MRNFFELDVIIRFKLEVSEEHNFRKRVETRRQYHDLLGDKQYYRYFGIVTGLCIEEFMIAARDSGYLHEAGSPQAR